MVAQVEQRMVAQVEQESKGWWCRWSRGWWYRSNRRAEDGGAGRAGGQRMVALVEQEGGTGGAGGAGGQRMVAQVEQEGRGWWHRWSRRAEDGGMGGTEVV